MPKISAPLASKLKYMKYVVLIAVCLLCIMGYGSMVSGASPWTAFSQLRTGAFAFRSHLDVIGLVLFAAISIGMILVDRFFCRFLCPFGAVFALMPVIPFATLHRNANQCRSGCKACHSVCPAGLQLPYRPADPDADAEGVDRDNGIYMGECFQCGKCAHVCSVGNAQSEFLKIGNKGIAIDLCKAAILTLLLYLVL